MSFADYVAPQRTILLPGDVKVPIKGLSVANIVEIVAVHKEEMVSAFNRITAGAKDGNTSVVEQDVMVAVGDMLQKFPTLAAHIVAAGLGDSKLIQKAADLPIGVQMEALNIIGEMTFEISGGAKNVVEIVIKMLAGSCNLVGQLNEKN